MSDNDLNDGLLEVAETTRRLMEEGPICDNCLGRAFAHLSTGLTNQWRGRAIKVAMSMAAGSYSESAPDWLNRSLDFVLESKGETREPCWLCNDIFKDVDTWAKRCLDAAEAYEFHSYLVGTRLPGLLAEKEEIVVTEFGLDHAEPLKSEINREVGKALGGLLERSGAPVEFDLKMPDIVFFLDIEGGEVELEVRSLFLAGRYRKLVRGIPQTHWDCRECRGAGCESCNNTGKQYPESVEELISTPLLEATGGTKAILHGAGREDIDARMLGSGRPFVMELLSPKRRTVDTGNLAEGVSRMSDSRVEVDKFEVVDRDMVRVYKQQSRQKVYRLQIKYEKAASTDELEKALNTLTGNQVEQQTPDRVVHRRADLTRIRSVHETRLVGHDPPQAVIELTCDGGLYVKELVNGDGGRTKPSLSALLGIPVSVLELDVIEVKEANNGEVAR